MRTMHLARTASRTWHSLLYNSLIVRHRLYLSTTLDVEQSRAWLEKSAFPVAEPNPWIPHLLLNQRSWGSAWPFETMYTRVMYEDLNPSQPRFWTFSLELRREQYSCLPSPGPWRDLLATSPPFTDFWYTRCFYELGSGRAPFVTHIDYDSKVPKSRQKYRVHCPNGVTLGHIADAIRHLFELHSGVKFVMVESIRNSPEFPTKYSSSTTQNYLPDGSNEYTREGKGRRVASDTSVIEEEEGPTTRSWVPGLSAEQVHEWY